MLHDLGPLRGLTMMQVLIPACDLAVVTVKSAIPTVAGSCVLWRENRWHWLPATQPIQRMLSHGVSNADDEASASGCLFQATRANLSKFAGWRAELRLSRQELRAARLHLLRLLVVLLPSQEPAKFPPSGCTEVKRGQGSCRRQGLYRVQYSC